MSDWNHESTVMRDTRSLHVKNRIERRSTARKGGRCVMAMLPLVIGVTVMTACEGVLDVDPDPHFVDAIANPAQLNETMVGAEVDLNNAYDVWVYETNMTSGGMVALGLLRYTGSLREFSRGGGQAGGLTGGGRESRGPGVAYYAFLQQAIASSHRAQLRILSGEFEGLSESSEQFSRAALFNGWEILWLATFYCEFVLYGDGPVHTSQQGYQMAADQFQASVNAAGATDATRSAARAGLARANWQMGNESAAVQNAALVDPDFKYQATYSTNTFEQTNRVWFRTWGFGEHAISAAFRNLTVDDTGTPDPRTLMTLNPVPPRGDLDQVYAPNKIPSGGSPLNITSGVEMQYIVAEGALSSNPDLTVQIINENRVRRGLNIVWTPAGTGPNEIRDKLIDERRRTLLVEGTIMGENRLYIDKYGLNLFHTTIPQGLPVGSETCRALPQTEIDNIPGLVYTVR